MEKKTYDFFKHEDWDIWNKPIDPMGYIFTYRHPKGANENTSKYNYSYQSLWCNPVNKSEGIYENEDFRGWFLTNSTDNEFYIAVKNEHLDTEIYTVNSLAAVMEFICDTYNPKQLNGTIHIHEMKTDTIKSFGGVGGLGLPVTPNFCISQENLNIIHCDDFGRYYPSNVEILHGIKRYCEKFLIEKLLSYKNFN